MYENETSSALPFIYLFIHFFLEALQTSFDFLKKYYYFFLQQFKQLIQNVICCISRFGQNSVLALHNDELH